VSEVCHRFDPLPQVLKNVRTGSGKRPLDNDGIRTKIEDANQRLGATGRLVVRASGTEPLVRVMAEGEDRDLILGIVDDLVAALGEAAA
jgi:phosphoglucosamine mutase